MALSLRQSCLTSSRSVLSHSRSLSSSSSTLAQRGTQLTDEQLHGLSRRERRALIFGHAEKSRPKSHVSAMTSSIKKEATQRPRKTNDDTLMPGGKKILEPHTLSKRLLALCGRGQLEMAIEQLKNSPLDAQNTPVWNTMIWECLKSGRYALAYKIYIDMRRRGFSATTRTYQTMLAGLSRIEHWSSHPKQLNNARNIYDAYRRHIASLVKHEPESDQISTGPLPYYIKILSACGQYQEAMEVFSSIQSPLQPNHVLFTAMFEMLATAGKDIRSQASLNTKTNLTDASSLWDQAINASNQSPGFEIDSHLVTSAILAMAHGRPKDRNLGFKLVRDYFGLVAREDDQPAKSILPLSSPALNAALTLCLVSERPQACLDFFEYVQKHNKIMTIIDYKHVLQALEAQRNLIQESGSDLDNIRARLEARPTETHGAKATVDLVNWSLQHGVPDKIGVKIRPTVTTYHSALVNCWRAKDWTSATHLFELMTGYHCHDFADGVEKKEPSRVQRSGNMDPTAETISLMVRVARSTHNVAAMRQALRLTEQVGLPAFVQDTTTRKKARLLSFFTSKQAQALGAVVNYVIENGKTNRPEDVARWFKLAGSIDGLAGSYEEQLESTKPSNQPAPAHGARAALVPSGKSHGGRPSSSSTSLTISPKKLTEDRFRGRKQAFSMPAGQRSQTSVSL